MARPEFGRGCSSGVEHDLAKVGVEGSNPFARSKSANVIKTGNLRGLANPGRDLRKSRGLAALRGRDITVQRPILTAYRRVGDSRSGSEQPPAPDTDFSNQQCECGHRGRGRGAVLRKTDPESPPLSTNRLNRANAPPYSHRTTPTRAYPSIRAGASGVV